MGLVVVNDIQTVVGFHVKNELCVKISGNENSKFIC